MKATNQIVKNTIINQALLPLYFNADLEISINVLKSLYSAGIKAVEYTNRGEKAISNFKELIKVRNQELPNMLLGIGTIKNLNQAKDYLEIGADFLLSPGYIQEVADFSVKNDIFYSPGCMTPTEIIAAETAGITFIKLFPGNILGQDFLIAIKDIFPNLNFMPTGGVDTTKENIESWFKAGVSAVGMGSKLVSKNLMETKDYDTIKKETIKVLEIIKTIN
jgi:2-dehydro-3-deoxyphosphogluconate aldolase / (4S)-4-hydroxy-2-oxoglutarate aldolase